MNDFLVSVIIPVYNASEYISKCIESVINQTYPNWELILIDDGSNDNSLEICKYYSSKDNRIITLTQKNSGPSAARNSGIAISKGKYVTFIDSDDYITKTYLSDMLIFDCDIVASGIHLEYTYDRNSTTNCFKKNGIFKKNLNLILFEGEYNSLWKSPCAKLYKKQIITENKFHFDTKLNYGEDHIFNLKFISKCNSIATIKNANYIYMHYGKPSLTNRSVPHKIMFQYILECYNLRNRLIFQLNIRDKEYKKYIEHQLVFYYWQTYHSLYVQEQNRNKRYQIILHYQNLFSSKIFKYKIKLPIRYKVEQIISSICPTKISELIISKL